MYMYILDLSLVNLPTWYLLICHRLLHVHAHNLGVPTYQGLEGEGDLLEKVQHGVDHIPAPQQVREPESTAAEGTYNTSPPTISWLAALKVKKARCTFYHVRVDILVNELGEVAVSQLLDSAPNVAKLEHQQLCTLLQFLIPSSVSRLGGIRIVRWEDGR